MTDDGMAMSARLVYVIETLDELLRPSEDVLLPPKELITDLGLRQVCLNPLNPFAARAQAEGPLGDYDRDLYSLVAAAYRAKYDMVSKDGQEWYSLRLLIPLARELETRCLLGTRQ